MTDSPRDCHRGHYFIDCCQSHTNYNIRDDPCDTISQTVYELMSEVLWKDFLLKFWV